MPYYHPLHRLSSGFFLALVLLISGCTDDKEPPPSPETTTETTSTKPTTAEIPLVTLHTAITGRLPLRRRATGKLRARREVVLKSRAGGEVITAPTEGTYYKEGTPLLATDPRPLELARDRAAAELEAAAFRERDLLLRLSTNLPPGDTTSITDLARANVRIQSGLPTAEVALAESEFQLSLAQLYAPFSGRAADVKVQAGARVGPGEEICTLTDLNSLEVEFLLLESEVTALSDKTSVWVTLPNSAPILKEEGLAANEGAAAAPPLGAGGLILNPKVGPGGLLRARARLRNYGKARLYPGMNVNVTLETLAPAAVLLPKSAVIERSGRTLVFAYDADSSRAKWLYVTVGYENDELVAVTEGVEAGQEIIVGGGFTLDHDSRVRVGE
jgi:multidrug efflux pump subunit AcrA (membrane-fusion protein)